MKKNPPAKDMAKTTLAVALLVLVNLINLGTSQAGSSENLFPRPPELSEAVDFWTRVYSEIDSNSGFIHDSRALGVVYEVYPLPTYASPKRQHRIIQKRIRHYEQLLSKIAVTAEQKLNREERRVKQLWGSKASPAQLRNAAKRIRFQRGQSDRMKKGLMRATKYEKRIRKILLDQGVPEQLAALPHVESSYNPKVRSKAGAAGLWQIMPATGRRYLRVNNVIDERLDPYKATTAAAQLLKHNHSVLKSWPLAITAYNHGLSGVRRAVRKTGTTDIETIIQQYNGRAFKFASRNFYAAFLAAYDVSTSQRAEIREKGTPDVPVIVLNTYLPAAVIIEGLQIDERKLKEHNPDLGQMVWSGEKYIPKLYPLHVPIKRGLSLLQAQIASLEKRSGHDKQVPDLFYRVQRGDNLAGIARRYNTSISTLMAMNSLRSRHRINAGQVLRVPTTNQLPAGATVIASSSADDPNADQRPDRVAVSVAQVAPESLPVSTPVSGSNPPLVLKNHEPGEVSADPAGDAGNETDESAVEETEAVADAQSVLAADPADYLVAEDGTIEVQVGETLGHYAHWLNLPTQDLRVLNSARYGQHLIVGSRLRLTFSTVNATTFEQKRKNYHAEIQNRFFKDHHIVDVTDHALSNGENLWDLSTQTYQIPLWLLRQYNPDLAFDTVLSLSSSLRIPVVQFNDESTMSPPAPASRISQQLVESN